MTFHGKSPLISNKGGKTARKGVFSEASEQLRQSWQSAHSQWQTIPQGRGTGVFLYCDAGSEPGQILSTSHEDMTVEWWLLF